MSGKKPAKKATGPKSVQKYEEETPRRPNTLGLIVLVAGGISTWYWYKPLPPEQNQGTYSDWTQAEREGLWNSTDLIRPTLESLDSEFGTSTLNEVEGLVEDGKKLVPVPVYKQNLDELLANEPAPSLPVWNDIPAVQVATPKVWTNGKDGGSVMGGLGLPNGSSQESRSLHARSLDWPDQGYSARREPVPAPPAMANNSPSLLPMSAASPSHPTQAIRTHEQSYGSSQTFSETRFQSSTSSVQPPAFQSGAIPVLNGTEQETAVRTPQIIRQPKRP